MRFAAALSLRREAERCCCGAWNRDKFGVIWWRNADLVLQGMRSRVWREEEEQEKEEEEQEEEGE